MRRFLRFPCCDTHLFLGAEGELPIRLLSQLADIMELPLMETPTDAPALILCDDISRAPVDGRCRLSRGVFYCAGVLYVDTPELFSDHRMRVFLMRLTISLGLLLKSVGSAFYLMHGSLLEKDDGAILLFGTSGIGKTTTMKRWRQIGGTCRADDMVLLEHDPDGRWFARPMPTWSRFFSDAGCRDHFPVSRRIGIRHLLWLSRAAAGEPEAILPAPENRYIANLLSAAVLHLYIPMRIFSDPEKIAIGKRHLELARRLHGDFPCRMLCASLQGDLQKTMRTLEREVKK